ncbi:MAG: thiamine phosphate synthase [Bacteroidota bacterium]
MTRLYLISPPSIDLPKFADSLKAAFDGGDIGCFQLRLKNASDDQILKAAEKLLPICHAYEAAFIMNDRPDLAVKCGADGVHVGQDDLAHFPSPLIQPSPLQASADIVGEGQGESGISKPPPHLGLPKDLGYAKSKANRPLPQGERENQHHALAAIRNIIGEDKIIGVSCHDSRHLAMEAGEAGADYVAFGAFYPTKSKDAAKLARYGVPTAEILSWWAENTVLPCVAIGGMTPANSVPLARAGADFIAVITAVWEHPDGPKQAVEEFNRAIAQ